MIIVVKDQDRVVIGYTIANQFGRLASSDYSDTENFALVQRNDYYYGFALMNRISDLFIYDELFLNLKVTPDNIINEVIPYIKNKLINNKKMLNNGKWDNALVICDNNHIYDISVKLEFNEIEKYLVHGYDEDMIISILDSTPNMPTKERIIEAFSFVSKLYKEDLFPIAITDTLTKEIKIIEKGE